METFGRWGTDADSLMKKLGQHVRDNKFGPNSSVNSSAITQRWWALFSVTLQRLNVRMLTNRASAGLAKTSPDFRPFPRGELWGRGPFQPSSGGSGPLLCTCP